MPSLPWSPSDQLGRPVASPADDAGADETLLRHLARVERQLRRPVSFSMALPRRSEAGSLAREAVRNRLCEELPASTLDDLTLVVSELVANAVVHGAGEIGLRLEVDGLTVKGEVIDDGAFEPPPPGEHGVDGVGGLGLLIVGRLVESWGVRPGTARVWFQTPVERPAGRVADRQRAPRGSAGVTDA